MSGGGRRARVVAPSVVARVALAPAMSLVVVVPRGLGETFRSRIEAAGNSIEQIVGGADRGDAAVDFLLVSGCGGIPDLPPVVAVFALLAVCEYLTRDALVDAIHNSEKWPSALNHWRTWRNKTENPATFRATALREDGLDDDMRTKEIASAAESGTWRRWEWAASMEGYDIEVIAIWLKDKAIAGVVLTPGWQACVRAAKGGFWPVEAPAYGVSDEAPQKKRHHDPTQPVLRPSVCFGLLERAGVKPTDLLCDPMCGVGSLPAEALSTRFKCAYALGGDSSKSAIRDAGKLRRNGRLQKGKTLDVARWDVRCLPLRSSCIDALVVDVPWGARNAAKAPLDASLLREALSEVNRVLVVDGVALVLLTRAAAQTIPRLVSNAGDGSHCLRVLESLDICVGGWPVAAVTLRKVEAEPPTDGASAEAEEPTAASNAIITPCCCTIEVTSSLSNLPLSELLLVAFPHAIRSASAARRALKHRRVALASNPSTLLWPRGKVGVGETLILRPHLARYQPTEVLEAMEQLVVLWEDAEWVCVIKPAGMGVLQGKRSLANALLALQLSRGDVNPSPARADTRAPPLPWTPAYDGPSRVGGAWLGAKTPLAAASLMGPSAMVVPGYTTKVTLSWRAIVKGQIGDTHRLAGACGMLDCSGSVKEPTRIRTGRSVRYGSIQEISFGLDYVYAEVNTTANRPSMEMQRPRGGANLAPDGRTYGQVRAADIADKAAWLEAHLGLEQAPTDGEVEERGWKAEIRRKETIVSYAAKALGLCGGLDKGDLKKDLDDQINFLYSWVVGRMMCCGKLDGWREVFASNGHPVIGDRPHCDGPTVCIWVIGVSVSGGRFNTPKSQRLLLRHPDGALEAPPPERFSRLFEREEAVCLCADRGELTSEYGKRLLKEREMEEKLAAEEEEEAAAEDGEEEDEDPPEVT